MNILDDYSLIYPDITLEGGYQLGRRRRKIVRRPKKTLPTIFLCPACGENTISIQILKDFDRAEVKCSRCNIRADYSFMPVDQHVDIYCKFTDEFYAGSIEEQG